MRLRILFYYEGYDGGRGWKSSVAYTITHSIIYKTHNGGFSQWNDKLQVESSSVLSPLTQVFIDHLACHPIAV